MFRKLTFLALLGGAIAALIKSRSRGGTQTVTPEPQPATPQQAHDARPDLPEEKAQEPIAGVGDDEQSVIPDTSADDPLVREQEDAARADAAAIGGDVDSATADTDPAMRPVVEGAGDAPETFETTDEQGR